MNLVVMYQTQELQQHLCKSSGNACMLLLIKQTHISKHFMVSRHAFLKLYPDNNDGYNRYFSASPKRLNLMFTFCCCWTYNMTVIKSCTEIPMKTLPLVVQFLTPFRRLIISTFCCCWTHNITVTKIVSKCQ